LELGFFLFLQIVTAWLVPSAGQKIPAQPGWYLPRSRLLKTGFFRQVRELKIQRKNPGSALRRERKTTINHNKSRCQSEQKDSHINMIYKVSRL